MVSKKDGDETYSLVTHGDGRTTVIKKLPPVLMTMVQSIVLQLVVGIHIDIHPACMKFYL
jgi:hypothetical protein